MNRHITKRGVTLIEVVVGSSILLIFLTALIPAYILYLNFSSLNTSAIKAAFLAEEGVEVVKFLRDTDWDTYIASSSVDTEYYLSFDGSSWQINTTPIYIDDSFQRHIIFSEVYRDGVSDIAETGTLDVDARKVEVVVSWQAGNATSTKSIETYITNFFKE